MTGPLDNLPKFTENDLIWIAIEYLSENLEIPDFLCKTVSRKLNENNGNDNNELLNLINTCIKTDTQFNITNIKNEINNKFSGSFRGDSMRNNLNNSLTEILKNNGVPEDFINEILNNLHKNSETDAFLKIDDILKQISDALSFSSIKFGKLNGELKKYVNPDSLKNFNQSIGQLKSSIFSLFDQLKQQGSESYENGTNEVKAIIVNAILLQGYENLKKAYDNHTEKQNELGGLLLGNLGTLTQSITTHKPVKYPDIPLKVHREFDPEKLIKLMRLTIGGNSENEEWWQITGNVAREINKIIDANINNQEIETLIKSITDKIGDEINKNNLNEVFYKELLDVNKVPRYIIDAKKGVEILNEELYRLIVKYIDIKQNKTDRGEIAKAYVDLHDTLKSIIFHIGIIHELENEKLKEEKRVQNENLEFANSIKLFAEKFEFSNNVLDKLNEIKEYIKDNYKGSDSLKSTIDGILKIINDGNNYYKELFIENKKLSGYTIDLNYHYEKLSELMDTIFLQSHKLKVFKLDFSTQGLIKQVIIYASIIIELEKRDKIAKLRESSKRV